MEGRHRSPNPRAEKYGKIRKSQNGIIASRLRRGLTLYMVPPFDEKFERRYPRRREYGAGAQ